MSTDKYNKLNTISRTRYNETNDCAVIATCLAGRLEYHEVHKAFGEYGRRKGMGVPIHIIWFVWKRLGLKFEMFEPRQGKTGHRYTPKTIGKQYAKGYYICETERHVFALINGVVHDWTDGRKHPIKAMYKITKTRGV